MPTLHRSAGLFLALICLIVGAAQPAQPARAVEPTALFIVQLAGEPLAAYAGRIAAAERASPTRALQSPRAAAHRARLASRRAEAISLIAALIGERPAVSQIYDTALHGLALPLTADQAARVATLPGVLAVWPEQLHTLDSDSGPPWIGADQIWGAGATGVYAATILGSNASPPVDTPLSGRGTFSLAANALGYTVTITGSAEPVAAASLRRSSDGSLVAGLAPAAPGAYAGSLDLAPGDLALLQGGGLFVRVDTSSHPGGAARGPIAGYQGEGVVVGIIDSGINTTHPAFAEVGGDGYRHLNPLGQGVFRGACDPTNLPAAADGRPAGYNPAITCNNKLIGTWTFTQTAVVPNAVTGEPSPNDENGHGSHTAGTAAGNVLYNVRLGGSTFARISGVAPHASIIAYDVCGLIGDNGRYQPSCSSAAILAAIDQAVRDGVDVINYSISGGSSPWDDPVELAFLSARAAGVVVSTSAGNSGPRAGSVAHVSPWLMSTAAATHNRRLGNGLADLSADGGATLPDIGGSGSSSTTAIGVPLIYAGAAGVANPLCGPFSPGQAALVAGAIVICDAGTYGSVDKAANVQAAGGAGYVLANAAAAGGNLSDDSFPIPGVQITYANGVALKAWVAASANPTGRISSGVPRPVDADGDVLAAFSARGPSNGALAGVLKPDLAAPGVSVLAAIANSGGATPDVGMLSGTSMAAPHIAGAAALLVGLHPSWTPGQIQSALMTTALAPILKEDQQTPSTPLDSGAGRVRVDRAARAGLVLDETVARLGAANPADGGDLRDLNLPSMADPACISSCAWTRTVRSTLAVPVTWSATADSSGLSVEPARFTIPAGGTQTLTITFDVGGATIAQYRFGRVTLSADGGVAPDVGLPVAALPARSDLPARLILSAASGVTSDTIALRFTPYTNLLVQQYGLVRGTPHSLALSGEEVYITTLVAPAGTARLVAEIQSSTSHDIDLYIYQDDGDGALDPGSDALACTSASGAVLESCSMHNPAAGIYFIWVENYDPSDSPPDPVALVTAVVPQANAANLAVRLPTSGAGSVALDIALSEPRARPGERWYGWLSLADGSSAVTLGTADIDFRHIGTAGPQQLFLPFAPR